MYSLIYIDCLMEWNTGLIGYDWLVECDTKCVTYSLSYKWQ